MLSHVQLFVTQWTVALQAPLSMDFSRQEYWSGLPFPIPGGLSNPGIELVFSAWQAERIPSEPSGSPQIRSDSIKTSMRMINIKFRVKITFGERKKGNEIREQYIEYFKSISNVLHLKKKNIYLFGCACGI